MKNSKENKPLSPTYKRKHKLLIDEVADHANIRRDVVKDVLESFTDVLVERLLNEGKFILKDVLSIHTITTKNGIRPEPHLQFRAKVALGLRKLLQQTESKPEVDVTRYSWRSQVKELNRKSRGEAKSQLKLEDFLQDDDEDE